MVDSLANQEEQIDDMSVLVEAELGWKWGYTRENVVAGMPV